MCIAVISPWGKCEEVDQLPFPCSPVATQLSQEQLCRLLMPMDMHLTVICNREIRACYSVQFMANKFFLFKLESRWFLYENGNIRHAIGHFYEVPADEIMCGETMDVQVKGLDHIAQLADGWYVERPISDMVLDSFRPVTREDFIINSIIAEKRVLSLA